MSSTNSPGAGIDSLPQNPIDLFTQRLTAVGGHVHRAATVDDAARAIVQIASLPAGVPAWISPALAERAPGLVTRLRERGWAVRQPESAAEVRDQPLGIGIAEAAVGETGSVIMSEPRIPGRAVTLMTETLVIVCETGLLVPSLDEAAPILRGIGSGGASYATFITGPSRTADIERQLTVGVQGPGEHHVVLVDTLN